MRIDRKLYDANLRLLEVELEMAEFPEDVTWDLRQEMPREWREHFGVVFETFAFGYALKGRLYFEQVPANDTYRFACFEVEFTGEKEMPITVCRFDRREGVSVGLREALNLMQRRPVYLDYKHNRNREGYWVELTENRLGEPVVCASPISFLVEVALERGLFRKRLGAEACYELARALEKGDHARVEINGKEVFVDVDLLNERLVLTNSAGRPAKLHWWEVFFAGR